MKIVRLLVQGNLHPFEVSWIKSIPVHIVAILILHLRPLGRQEFCHGEWFHSCSLHLRIEASPFQSHPQCRLGPWYLLPQPGRNLTVEC